ncbi:hypothetical protein [Actinomyces vulturis]|uniref:hypothetical protein n=1 Tax=Actinomyces vulturis TaxID=1857645 RepID=UPI00082CC574|nr:hypothetical protein [Actinomyces vulturis]
MSPITCASMYTIRSMSTDQVERAGQLLIDEVRSSLGDSFTDETQIELDRIRADLCDMWSQYGEGLIGDGFIRWRDPAALQGVSDVANAFSGCFFPVGTTAWGDVLALRPHALIHATSQCSATPSTGASAPSATSSDSASQNSSEDAADTSNSASSPVADASTPADAAPSPHSAASPSCAGKDASAAPPPQTTLWCMVMPRDNTIIDIQAPDVAGLVKFLEGAPGRQKILRVGPWEQVAEQVGIVPLHQCVRATSEYSWSAPSSPDSWKVVDLDDYWLRVSVLASRPDQSGD